MACASSISPASLPNGQIGVPYNQLFTPNEPGTFFLTVVIGALPDGLSLSGMSIVGTPTAPGTFNFTIKVDYIIPSPFCSSFTQAFTIIVPAQSNSGGAGGAGAIYYPPTICMPKSEVQKYNNCQCPEEIKYMGIIYYKIGIDADGNCCYTKIKPQK